MHPISNSLQQALEGRYAIEHELGRGGMATVYRAHDLRHDRPVALKVLRGEVGVMLGEERFLREIRLTARLRHPHILPVFDSGSASPELWYVTPCVESGSLRTRLEREGRLPLDDAVGVTRNVLAALGYAHGTGIVHRDIKPENILMEAGEAIVADFGIARAVHEASGDRLTETGLSLGTPAYMSPEQVTGEPTLDGRSDLYAVGCVLFEMLTGEPPHTGPNLQAVFAKKLLGTAPSVRSFQPAVPEAVDTCIARALAASPADRFATAEEFAQALETARTQELAATRRVPPVGARGRRRLTKQALAATGGLILAALAALAMWRSMAPRSAPSPTRLAVLPFSVAAGPDLAYLGSGMVDLLSRNLDGAGEIRTLDPSRVLTALRKAGVSAGDAEQGREVARRLGAGQVVQGNVSAAGKQLRIQAELVETAGDSAIPRSRAVVEGDSTELFTLVDRLAAELIAEQARGPGFRLLQTAAFTTRSLPALKSYLKAEEHFRAVRPDSAIAGFRRAVDDDSAFALAHYRMAVAALWGNRAAQIDPALDRALRLADRLPERDRALVGALDAFRRGTPDTAERRYRAILRDYPDDLEANAELGLLLFNYNPLRGQPRGESGEIFRRVVELDPRFFCPIWPLISLAGREGDWTAFDTLNTLRFGRAGVPAAHTIVLRLRRGEPGIGAEARAQARTHDTELFHAADDVSLFLHDLASAEQLLRLGAGAEQGGSFRDSSYRRLAMLHVGQGRWSEAKADLARTAQPGRRLGLALYAGLPFVGASPAELKEIRAELERWRPQTEPPLAGSPLEAVLAPHLREWLLGMLDLRLGNDTAALARAAAIEREPAPPDVAAVVRSLAQTLRASVAGHRNRAAEALRLLESVRGAVPASLLRVPFFAEEPARYLRAELLQQLGRDREALDWLSNGFADTPAELAYLAPLELRKGEIYERLGERERAAEHYQRFLHLWEHCDPPLQALLSETRSRLARLLEEPRTGGAPPRSP